MRYEKGSMTMENLWDFFGITGINALVVAAITFFGKKSFESFLQIEVIQKIDDNRKYIKKELLEINSELKRNENKEIANHKHTLQETIEELKGQIKKNTEDYKIITGGSLDRKIRLNEKEISGLAECWEALIPVFFLARELCSKFMEHIDISQMQDNELDKFLPSFNLSENQIYFIKMSSDKNNSLFVFRRENDLAPLKEKSDCFRNRIEAFSPFIDKDIFDKFNQLSAAIENSWFASKKLLDKKLSSENNLLYTNMMTEIGKDKYKDFKNDILKEIKSKLTIN